MERNDMALTEYALKKYREIAKEQCVSLSDVIMARQNEVLDRISIQLKELDVSIKENTAIALIMNEKD